MKLKDYLKIENKIERLTKFINDNGEWQENYIDECPDFKDNYFDLIEQGTIYFDELEDETREIMIKEVENNGIQFLFDNDLIDCDIHCGYNRCSNELWSFSLGEIEVQFSGLSDGNINCIYSELIKDLTLEEIKEAADNSEYYVSNDCIYIDRSYDRVSFTLKEDAFLDYINNKEEK